MTSYFCPDCNVSLCDAPCSAPIINNFCRTSELLTLNNSCLVLSWSNYLHFCNYQKKLLLVGQLLLLMDCVTCHMLWLDLKFEPCKYVIAFIKLTFWNVKDKHSFILTIASIFPIKVGGSVTNLKTLNIILCDSTLSCYVIWQVSTKVYFFPNHFIMKYGYWFTCMRSFVSLGHKGNT